VVNGVVTPKTAGTATITATTVDGGYTATVEVVVAAAADVEITAFDAIANVDAGKAGSAIYADAAAVIAALPTDVTANSNAVTVPVTTWVDTDSYDPAVAGSYTFTATLGAIPAGFANTGGYTATVEVVVYAATFFNVTYHINGGSGTVPTQAPLTSGDTFTVASPTGLTAPTGKQFKEWNTSHYGIGTGYAPGSTFTMETSSVTLYAIWENIYTVTFVAGENGSLTGTTEFVDIMHGTAWGTAVTVPSPVADSGFKFKDWTPTFPATVTKNATYTANFVALSINATLSDLKVDGTTITSFNASTLTYNVELPAGTTTVPTVTATATDSKANAVVTAAASLPGSTTVLVTAEDGTTTKTYTIDFILNQAAPTGLAGVAPTTVANNDGKITGTTTEMEWRAGSTGEFKAVTGIEITGLATGTYEVRYAAKTGYKAGATAEVTVAAAAPTPITAIAAISGTAKVDVELTAGALTPAGATASYKWMICDTVDGTYVDIASATTNKYTPVAGDVGKFIKVVATGSGDYSGTATSAATAAVASGFAAGSGTEVDPYQVSSAEELNKVRNHLDKHFKQTENIDLSTYNTDGGWQPIGDSSTPFNGTYDGNSMTITGLVIDRAGSDYQGLFGKISKDATIKNCSVSGSVTGKDNVGGLVGSNDGGTISSCDAPSVSITGKDYVGGLVGFVRSSSGALATIEKSYASGSVKGVINVGGLVGLHSMQGNNIGGSIKNSYTFVSVDATGSYVGGLIGNNKADFRYEETSIENCYSKGSVKSSLEGVEGKVYIGGLVGGNNHNIKNSYAVGKVIVTNGADGFIGGLIGRLMGGGKVTSSYYDSTTTEQTDTGKGVGKTTEEMKQADTFVGWDFTNIWNIIDGSYPTLK